MSRYLVDTNVFLYARGGPHAYREPCRAVLTAARDGAVDLDASIELLQEYAHVLLRRSGEERYAVLDEVHEVRRQCRVHACDADVWSQATALLGRYPALGARDAVHAATALTAEVPAIISTDRVFDDLDEIPRVDPRDRHAPWR